MSHFIIITLPDVGILIGGVLIGWGIRDHWDRT